MVGPMCQNKVRAALTKCYEIDMDWSLIPEYLKEMCTLLAKNFKQTPTSVFVGLISLVSFTLGHASLEVTNGWNEPIIIWLSFVLSTGRCKSTFHKFLFDVLKDVRESVSEVQEPKTMILPHCTWDKFGDILANSGGRCMGLYDELMSFFSTMNMYSSAKLQISDTREYQDFLTLFTGQSKTRETITGNANFNIQGTSFSLLGFTQPQAAIPVVEDISNNTKGFTSRILWMFPKPVFCILEDCILEADEIEACNTFRKRLVDLLTSLYIHGEKTYDTHEDGKVNNVEVERTKFSLSAGAFEVFRGFHDEWEMKVCMRYQYDPLVAGLYSRGKSHLIRLAVPVHILLSSISSMPQDPDDIIGTQAEKSQDADNEDDGSQQSQSIPPTSIDQDDHILENSSSSTLEEMFMDSLGISTSVDAQAVTIAHSIVNMCLQQLGHITKHEVKMEDDEEDDEPEIEVQPTSRSDSDQMLRLLKSIINVPGSIVSFSLLNSRGLFRRYTINGLTGKNLHLHVIEELQKKEVGTVESFHIHANKTKVYFFIKQTPPTVNDDAMAFARKLAKVGSTIREYQEFYEASNAESQKHSEEYAKRKYESTLPVTPGKRKRPTSEIGFDDSDGSPSLKRNTQPSTSGISQL